MISKAHVLSDAGISQPNLLSGLSLSKILLSRCYQQVAGKVVIFEREPHCEWWFSMANGGAIFGRKVASIERVAGAGVLPRLGIRGQQPIWFKKP